MQHISIKKLFNLLFMLFFLGFIYSSSLIMLWSDKSVWSEAEKRSLTLFPPLPENFLQATVFFSSLDDYFDDHFGFRERYIQRYQFELNRLFNRAGSSSIVIKGLDGWHFLNQFGLLQDFLGRAQLSEKQLRTWLQVQDNKNSWLQAHSIHYQYLAIPNKQSVYPQYLMENGLKLKGTTRFEQLLTYTDNQLPPYMINVHELLRPELYDKPLYYKNDSHWNKLSAYVVFQKIMSGITERFPDESFTTEFEFAPDETGIGGNTGEGGDLVKILMQAKLPETYPQTKRFKRCGPYTPLPYRLSNIVQGHGRNSFVRRCSKGNLRAVIFRDSFLVPVEPFLSENFREIVYLWKEYDQQNLEEIMTYFKPDIVIEAIAERHMFDSLINRESNIH
jgi:alginate O-acetyltransferase complex protein AlgJ